MANISQRTIDHKINFIKNVIQKIRRGTATMPEIDKACDTIHWLYQWKVIDTEKSCELAEEITNAMEGKYDEG